MRRLLLAVGGGIGALLLRALGATWRFESEGRNPLEHEPGAQIGALWHRGVLVTTWAYRDRGFSVAISRSSDGDWISAVVERLGYRAPARGSSSRGGADALRALVRLVQAGVTVSVLTDGPRGPAGRSKPGVVSLARLTGVPITPVSFSARPCLRFRSWDGTLLPLPFARVACRYGEPIAVTGHASEADEERALEALDRELARITRELDARMGLRSR